MELAEGGRVAEVVDKMALRAREIAKKYGNVIGEVSRYDSIRVGAEGEVEIIVEPESYFSLSDPLRAEGLIAAVDIKSGRLVLMKINSIERAHELAMLGMKPPISGFAAPQSSTGLMTITRIRASPLLEADLEKLEDPAPATIAIEPQSPVIDPFPDTIARLLGLPERGILLGALSLPASTIKGGSIAVRLPYSAVLHHILIIGTTGSGKTTLIKNMVASLYSEDPSHAPITALIDMNQDFIQLTMRGIVAQSEILPVHKNVKHVKGVIIVLPVPLNVLKEHWSATKSARGGEALREVFKSVVSSYYREAIKPLLRDGASGDPLVSCKAEAAEGSGEAVEVCELRLRESTMTIVPFLINTLASSNDHVASLMPDLPMLGRDLMGFIRDEFRKESREGLAPPVHVIAAALRVYEAIQRGRRRNREGDEKEEIVRRAEEEARWILSRAVGREQDHSSLLFKQIEELAEHIARCFDAIDRLAPHDQTVMALHRRLLSLIETNIVDVMVRTERGLQVVPEATWSLMLKKAEEQRAPIIIDLKWPIDRGMGSLEEPRLIAYRLLKTLISWKNAKWAKRESTRDVMVVIDEAHQFFPQEGASREEQEASRQVASMISAIARLGRARGVGLVFSTHSPRDLHTIILQLTNTKIILRTEPQHLERLSVPQSALRVISYLPNRTALVMGHFLRGGYLYIKTSPPLVAHFDASYRENYV